ncbi:hypothetical protein BR93DRAFT_924793 [Coniochaeta sp. PMI_546]|nr:hypothetical protein BR93DRAFT_924793 [Coniochaeta sp. PMI_546]
MMLEEKYIGLALAISSSLAIGTSFAITKKVRRLDMPPTLQPPPTPTITSSEPRKALAC